MKTKRLSILHTPLNVSMSLLCEGGSTSQAHCAETGAYVPDRTLTPLVLTPSVYIQDPDGILESGEATLTGVAWYEIPEELVSEVTDESYYTGELSQYLIVSGSNGYTVSSGGTLTVAKNIPYLSPVVLVFTANIADTRSGKVIRVHATATLSTTSVVETATLSLDKPASFTFDPLVDTGVRTIVADYRLGGIAPDSELCTVYYWWYHEDEDGDLVLIDEDEDLFYESGQGTATLVIDPSYLDKERIVCKAEHVYAGDAELSSPTSSCLSAETTIVRRYGDYDFENYVHGGTDVASSASYVHNECVVTAGQEVLDSPSEFFTVVWYIKTATYSAGWRVIGYGDTIDIPTEDVADGVDVGLDLEEFAPHAAVAIDEDTVLADDDDNILTL